MLEQMRKGAGNWAAKILMVLLVISFGAWGIGDYITGRNAIPAVAKVGGREISANDFRDAMQRETANLQRRLGTSLTREQIQQFGLDESVLNGLISARLYEVAGEKLGLSTSPAVIREYILQADAFRGPSGQFDRLRYETFLRNEGFSEAMLVDLVRRDIMRDQMLGSLLSGIDGVPLVVADTLLMHRLETRVANYIRIDTSRLPAPPAATAEEIETFYKANAAQFSNPERRAIAWVSFATADFAARQSVSDAEIAEEYEAHKGDFQQEETRQVQQVVFTGEDEARAAFDAVQKGEDFIAMAARTRQLKPADIDLGVVTQRQLPAELAGPVFALPQPGIAAPVKSAFGWHLARVAVINPGSITPIADATPRLRAEISQRKASDALLKLRPQIEDMIAGGAALDEIARTHKAQLHALKDIDAQGKDPTGKDVPALPATQPALLATAFQLAENADPQILDQADGGFHVLDVTAMQPGAVRPLAEVQAEVAAAIALRKRAEAAELRANQVAERLRTSGELLKEAQALGVLAQTTPPLSRSGAPADKALSPAVVNQIFAAKQPGEVAVGPAAPGTGNPGDMIVARLTRIIPADLAAVAAERDRTRQQQAQSLVTDVEERLRRKLEAEIGVSVNAAARARAF